MIAAVVADDGEAAGDDVGVGDQHLLDAVQPRDGHLVQDVQVPDQRAQPGPGVLDQRLDRGGGVRRVDHERAQVGVDVDEGVGHQPQVRRPTAGSPTGSRTWVSRTVCPSVISCRVCGSDSSARASSRLPLSISRPRSSPGAGEGLPELVDDDPQVLLVDGADQLVHVEQQLLDGHRDGGPVLRDDRAVLEERPLVVVGLQQDVLLADGAAGGHDRLGVGRDLVGAGVHGQDDADAVVDQLHVADPPDRDAAVGHLGVDEDAAGVGEVGRDVVAGAEHQRGPGRRT